MWNPGASGANSSSSAQSQRQHVVPGDGVHHILQRGKTSRGTGNRAASIAPIPLVGSPDLRGTSEISHKSSRPCFLGLKFYVSVLNYPKSSVHVYYLSQDVFWGVTQAFFLLIK